METHAERGAEVLRRYKVFARGVAIVRNHHEAWDGSGVPAALPPSESIPPSCPASGVKQKPECQVPV
jgi:response regulator RpfG family c-di-GMP phosphodiesterase